MAPANSTYGATAATATGQRPAARTALPNIGALGGLERADGRLFEDKMTALEEFRFDGQKGGDRWKGRLERYFISKAPCLKVILKWVEEQDADEITERMLELAAGHALDERQREVLNTAIWGFLSNCIFGEAETIFKRAESLHGLDAWRRIVRHIDHGRSIRLEALRTEIRSLHLTPIKSLENVSLGIAEFENKINEYVEAGGKRPDEAEMKTDLLAMLPEGLRENLLWRLDGPGGFSEFKNMVQAQTAKVLLNRRRLPVHNVVEENPEDFDMSNIQSVEDFILAFRKFNNKGRTGPPRGPPRGPPSGPPKGPPRTPKCPNCGGEHEKTACKLPMLPISKRKCWTCGKEGCSSRTCPQRKKGNVQTVEEPEDEMHCFGLATVTDWQPVKRGNKPTPQGAKLADFISHENKFKVLGTVGGEPPPPPAKEPRRVLADEPSAAAAAVAADHPPRRSPPPARAQKLGLTTANPCA